MTSPIESTQIARVDPLDPQHNGAAEEPKRDTATDIDTPLDVVDPVSPAHSRTTIPPLPERAHLHPPGVVIPTRSPGRAPATRPTRRELERTVPTEAQRDETQRVQDRPSSPQMAEARAFFESVDERRDAIASTSGTERAEAFAALQSETRTHLAHLPPEEREAFVQERARNLIETPPQSTGRNNQPHHYDGVLLAEAIASLADHPESLSRAVAGLSQEQLDRITYAAMQPAGPRTGIAPHDVPLDAVDSSALTGMLGALRHADARSDRGAGQARAVIATRRAIEGLAGDYTLEAWRVGDQAVVSAVIDETIGVLERDTSLVVGTLRGMDPEGETMSLLFAFSTRRDEFKAMADGDLQPLTGERGRWQGVLDRLQRGDQLQFDAPADYYARGTAQENGRLAPPLVTHRMARANLGYFVGAHEGSIQLMANSVNQARRRYQNLATTTVALAREGAADLTRLLGPAREFAQRAATYTGRALEGQQADSILTSYQQSEGGRTASMSLRPGALPASARPTPDELRQAMDPRGILFPPNLPASSIRMVQDGYRDYDQAAAAARRYGSGQFRLEPWLRNYPGDNMLSLGLRTDEAPPELLVGVNDWAASGIEFFDWVGDGLAGLF